MKALTALKDSLLEVLEQNDFTVSEITQYDEETFSVELEWYSPAGEDYILAIYYDGTDENFVGEYDMAACNFDPDEHAAIIVDCRGENGVPSSIRALIDDADAIQDKLLSMIKPLYSAL